jgi:hypothetical protein
VVTQKAREILRTRRPARLPADIAERLATILARAGSEANGKPFAV